MWEVTWWYRNNEYAIFHHNSWEDAINGVSRMYLIWVRGSHKPSIRKVR